MIGINQLLLNTATVMAAVEAYYNHTTVKGGEIKVTNLEYDSTRRQFKVSFKPKPDAEDENES